MAHDRRDIVVVDDLRSLQELATIVASPGHRVRPIPSPDLALEAMRGRAPDLLLLDLLLPGAAALRGAMKGDASLAAVRVVSLGDDMDAAGQRAAFAGGVTDHLTRPYLPREVVARVGVHLELARSEVELSLESGSLMVIDDDHANRRLIARALTASGHRVSAYESGPLGLAAALLEAPEVLLVDASMPEIDGFEVCRRVTAHPLLGQMPVLFMSGHTDSVTREAAFEAGASDYMSKPVGVTELRARVGVAIQLARSRGSQAL